MWVNEKGVIYTYPQTYTRSEHKDSSLLCFQKDGWWDEWDGMRWYYALLNCSKVSGFLRNKTIFNIFKLIFPVFCNVMQLPSLVTRLTYSSLCIVYYYAFVDGIHWHVNEIQFWYSNSTTVLYSIAKVAARYSNSFEYITRNFVLSAFEWFLVSFLLLWRSYHIVSLFASEWRLGLKWQMVFGLWLDFRRLLYGVLDFVNTS